MKQKPECIDPFGHGEVRPEPCGSGRGSGCAETVERGRTLITAETQVEEIMEKYPQTVAYFIKNKVSPFSCAGAFPKTLGELLAARNVGDAAGFIKGLNEMIEAV
jgi:hypothetical protein